MSLVGPLEILVIPFPGAELSERAAHALRMVEVTGDVRIVDALVVAKGRDGDVRAEKTSTIAMLADVTVEYGLIDLPRIPIQADDVADIAAVLPAPSAALALLVEHVWAREAAEAARTSDGVPATLLRIPKQYSGSVAACAAQAAVDGR